MNFSIFWVLTASHYFVMHVNILFLLCLLFLLYMWKYCFCYACECIVFQSEYSSFFNAWNSIYAVRRNIAPDPPPTGPHWTLPYTVFGPVESVVQCGILTYRIYLFKSMIKIVWMISAGLHVFAFISWYCYRAVQWLCVKRAGAHFWAEVLEIIPQY